MRQNPYEGVYIVGAGQADYEKRSTKSVHRVLWEALDAGLRSAGLPFRSVEGLALTCFVLPPDNVTTIAEHFGIEARFMFQGLYGGASGIIGMLHAARAIRDGDADVVAVLAGAARLRRCQWNLCLADTAVHGTVRRHSMRFRRAAGGTAGERARQPERAVQDGDRKSV